jgi:nucleoporin NUP2
VGFGFGSPPRTLELEGAGATEKAGSVEGEKGQSNESETSAAPIGLFGTSPHDEEGEGEEEEDTIYSAKLRAFRLKKEDEAGGSGWVELGYGMPGGDLKFIYSDHFQFRRLTAEKTQRDRDTAYATTE